MNDCTIKLSVKHSPIAKPRENKGGVFTFNWQAVSLSPAQIVQHITSGKPIAVGQFENGHRNKKHFIQSSLIALDYDGNYSDTDYQALIAHEFFNRCAFAIIQTASSKPESRRCRVLFQLDQIITDVNDYNDLVLCLIALAPDGADHGARDSSRAFYGSQPGTIPDFYNPLNRVHAAPHLAEIRRQREHAKQERETRRDIEFSGDFLRDIEKALGVTGYNSEGWSNAVACVMAHDHDDTRPAAFWHEESHILHCFKCGADYLAKDVANHFGITRAANGKLGRKGDLSNAPYEEKRRPQYALCALPGELRKVMIRDGMTNFCRIIDALLWEEVGIEESLSTSEIIAIMARYSMSRATVYRALSALSQNINSKNVSGNTLLDFEIPRYGTLTIADILERMEKHYSYKIIDAGSFLQDHLSALNNAREYRIYTLLETIPAVDSRITGGELAVMFSLSRGTISVYTKELKHRNKIEITAHYKKYEMQPDDFRQLSRLLSEYRTTYANAYFEMYRLRDGVRVPFNHKGGKSGIPNNRIPATYEAVMNFLDPPKNKHKQQAASDIIFIMVMRQCNSYRRLKVA